MAILFSTRRVMQIFQGIRISVRVRCKDFVSFVEVFLFLLGSEKMSPTRVCHTRRGQPVYQLVVPGLT
ncbi:hypothetical protein RRG08_024252 [Elysia crispata]|uniref:Uncharacterized protein n=1 Tax=Elysia crispata TaxID=231223 RepID=A0AAE1D970_9GAST|nr:hypothetical protein RRG08_024252 [Elysia crispata]